MLALNPIDIFTRKSIILQSMRDGKPSFSKCCALSDNVELRLLVERQLGVVAPRLLLHSDGSRFVFNADFSYSETNGGYDVYLLTVPVPEICGKPSLLFYRIAFSVGDATVYFASSNNVDGFLTYDESYSVANEFKMSVYTDDYTTPKWFHDGVMYHIFVDRFCRGSKKVPIREDAVMNDDWYDGIPQYGNHPGDFCSNNMFFGGTLYGVCEKLDMLSSLGVSVIYLSPIFEAYSNHKYDTGDYSHVDEMFGGDEALKQLIAECDKRGIKIILDGVFNHTGDDSIYFNKYGRYGNKGAYNDPQSPYRDWYYFTDYPDEYSSWWGITILPKLNTKNPDVEDYLAGDNGIAAKYLDMGISGYRLDVADELPDSFLCRLRKTVKSAKPDALIIGEVWENAADKCAYGLRRSYFLGKQLDGVMNYPIKNGIVDYVCSANAVKLYDAVCDIYSSYPMASALSLMNILGTHDTERIITVLGTRRYEGMCGDELCKFKMTEKEYAKGKTRLLCASVLQYTLPGVPSLFYGDEAGTQGCHDPFCRKTYPWGREDVQLLEHYKKIGNIRRSEPALCRGDIKVYEPSGSVFCFDRVYNDEKITIVVNMGSDKYCMDVRSGFVDLYNGSEIKAGKAYSVPACGFAILKEI